MIGINRPAVTAWLGAHVEGIEPPLRFELLAGGHSNLTYRITDSAGRRLVLRRPPMGALLSTAHDMVREHRLVSAISGTTVPVPPALGLCTDVGVNEAPFYVMGYVEGIVLDAPSAADGMAPATRKALGENLIDVMSELHAVDIDAVGLGDLGRREGYIERQLRRWAQQWQSSKTRELPAIDEVERRLRQRIPAQQSAAVVHGDYRFGNCLVAPNAGRITAVLDWELCALGDPLADLGYLGVYWTDEGEQPRRPDVTAAGGFPPYSHLVSRYAIRTGRDVSAVPYYRAFSSWRLAIILEGVYARYLQGVMGDAEMNPDRFRVEVEQLSQSALEWLSQPH